MLKNKLNLLLVLLTYCFSLILISSCDRRDTYSQSATPEPSNTDTFNPNPSPTNIINSPTNPTRLTSNSPETPTSKSTASSAALLQSNPLDIPKQNSIADKTNQLTIKKSFLARKTTDGRVIPVNNANFKRGEDIYFVLLNVGKFQKGADGKNWIDLDIIFKNSRGKIVATKQNMLGEKGNTLLNNDVAISPYGTVNTNKKVPPGKYHITLIVRDKISGVKLSTTKTLILQ